MSGTQIHSVQLARMNITAFNVIGSVHSVTDIVLIVVLAVWTLLKAMTPNTKSIQLIEYFLWQTVSMILIHELHGQNQMKETTNKCPKFEILSIHTMYTIAWAACHLPPFNGYSPFMIVYFLLNEFHMLTVYLVRLRWQSHSCQTKHSAIQIGIGIENNEDTATTEQHFQW